MITAKHILTLAKAYATSLNVPLSTASSRVFDDGKKLTAIEDGGDITLGRANAAVQSFSDHWPADAEWPPEMPRPVMTPQKVAAE